MLLGAFAYAHLVFVLQIFVNMKELADLKLGFALPWNYCWMIPGPSLWTWRGLWDRGVGAGSRRVRASTLNVGSTGMSLHRAERHHTSCRAEEEVERPYDRLTEGKPTLIRS